MADDNIQLNPGVGGKIAATDDVDGVHFQRIKLDVGGNGVSAPVVGALPVLDEAVLSLLKLLIARVQPLSIITGAGSNRLSVDVNNIIGGTLGTITQVSTVATVVNQTNMGGVTAFGLMHAASRTAFNTGTRTRL